VKEQPSEQVSSAPSVWEPSISPSPRFPPPPVSSISRYGGAPAALLTGSYFLMRVDVDTGEARTLEMREARIARQCGQDGRIPIVSPSHPRVLSHDTSVVYRGAGGAAPLGWSHLAGAQPTLSRIRRGGTFGGRESSWDVVPTVY
jgi:hypothetical protein